MIMTLLPLIRSIERVYEPDYCYDNVRMVMMMMHAHTHISEKWNWML